MNENALTPPLPAYRQAIYNPGRLTDGEIRASYIARQALFEHLLEEIDATRPGGIPQHHLLIGQRGMGKTILLHRLDVALRESERAARFVPLIFPEEQWTIDRLSKLWLNCLDSLADTLEREGKSPEIVEAIDEAVDRLTREHEKEELLAEAAEKTFLVLAARLGRRPVLLLDNIDLIFDRLGVHEVSRLRAFMMPAGAPVFVGACVSPPAQTSDYGAPLYDHFKTHYLERLSVDDMHGVLVRLAVRSGEREVAARIEAERPRLQALHALTGGNPRTTVILFQIFIKGFSQEAYEDLEALLDWMTPLYKARFEELPPQAQVIVGALASHWAPATSRQIGELTRLENKQVTPQLDRLRKADLLEEVLVDPEDQVGPLPEGRTPQMRTGYQLAERLFNLWFLMCQATRHDRCNLTFLTRFIESIHTQADPGLQDACCELGEVLDGHLCRYLEAEKACRGVVAIDPHFQVAWDNLISAVHDHFGRMPEAERLAAQLPTLDDQAVASGVALHLALFAADEKNWGVATEHLGKALELIADDAAIPAVILPGWMRATAVLLHLGYGAELLRFLDARAEGQRLRPWYEAIRAHLRGDRRYLRNIPAEMREVAGLLFDQIKVRLDYLPADTRRWSAPGQKKPGARRASRH